MENKTIGYCVKCKMKREISNPEEGITKNNRRVLKGICSVCGTKMMRFLPTDPTDIPGAEVIKTGEKE